MKLIKTLKQKSSIIFICLGLIVFIALTGWLGAQFDLRNKAEVKVHGEVVSEQVWNLDTNGAKAYLNLAVQKNHYKRLTIHQGNNSIIFIDVKGKPLFGIEKFLESVNLIYTRSYTAPIFFNDKQIGSIHIEKWDKTIYIYFNIFILELLIILVFLLYRQVISDKNHLSIQVAERTSDLTNLNLALKRSEAKFRSFSEHTFFGILVLQEKSIIYSNYSAENLLQMDSSWMEGKKLEDLETELIKTKQLESDQQIFQSGTIFKVSRGDEEVIWIEVNRQEIKVAATDQHSDLTLIYLIDVTEKKENEKITSRLSSILEVTTDLVATFDPDLTISFLNQAAAEFLGCQSQNAGSIINIYPEKSLAEITEKAIPSALKNGLWIGETMIQGHKQQTVPVSQIILSHYDEQKQVMYLSTVIRDISERKQFETEQIKLKEQLNSIINAMLSALISIDANRKVLHWNKAAEKLTGIPSMQALGVKLDDLLPALFQNEDLILNKINKPEPSIIPKVQQTLNHNAYYLDISIFPLDTPHIKGAVIRLDDISEKVRLEEIMVQSEKMLSIGGLAAGMAHEINNPLAAMMQNIQVIQRRIKAGVPKNEEIAAGLEVKMPAIEEYLEARDVTKMMKGIIESGQRASKIISNMLSFSRKSDSQLLPQYMDQLMDETIDLAYSDYSLKKQYDFKQVKIEKFYQTGMSQVQCEKSQMQQVILNLLKNGVQAMSDKKYPEDENPTFELHLSQVSGEMIIEIQDNGPGIPEEIKKRIFEPFYTTKATGIGTGLGLSVSYFIITENHKGTMEVHSEENRGTRFTIRLPI